MKKNITPYDGRADFLSGATDRTKVLWKRMSGLLQEEIKKGILDCDPHTPSLILSHPAGYLTPGQEIPEKIVGLQTDGPLKRAIKPFGGVGIIKQALYVLFVLSLFHVCAFSSSCVSASFLFCRSASPPPPLSLLFSMPRPSAPSNPSAVSASSRRLCMLCLYSLLFAHSVSSASMRAPHLSPLPLILSIPRSSGPSSSSAVSHTHVFNPSAFTYARTYGSQSQAALV